MDLCDKVVLLSDAFQNSDWDYFMRLLIFEENILTKFCWLYLCHFIKVKDKAGPFSDCRRGKFEKLPRFDPLNNKIFSMKTSRCSHKKYCSNKMFDPLNVLETWMVSGNANFTQEKTSNELLLLSAF